MFPIDLSKKLILLDRDGVLNQDRADYVKTLEELIIFPQVLTACRLLNAAGIRIGVCTNQAGIEKGLYSHTELDTIHNKLQETIKQAGGGDIHIVYCPFQDDNHPLRKPNPGMLLAQAAYFALELSGVPFIGDDYKDIQAAQAAGATPVLVATGKGAKTKAKYAKELEQIRFYPDLLSAVQDLLSL